MKTYPLSVLLGGLALMLAACASPKAPSNAVAAQAADSLLTAQTTTALGQAPDFVLPTLAGDSLRLSELRGRIVVVNLDRRLGLRLQDAVRQVRIEPAV